MCRLLSSRDSGSKIGIIPEKSGRLDTLVTGMQYDITGLQYEATRMQHDSTGMQYDANG